MSQEHLEMSQEHPEMSQEHPEMSQEHLEISRSIPKYPGASRNVQEHPEVSKSPKTTPEKATFTKSNQKLFRSIRKEDLKKKHHYKSLPTLSKPQGGGYDSGSARDEKW